MRRIPAVLAMTLLATSQSAHSAKPPPPPPGTSNPEIGYVRIGNKGSEFILSNEDGTGKSVIFTARSGGQMVVHLGPRAHKTFALIQGGKISLGRYKQVATGLALDGVLVPIHDGNHIGSIDAEFSRDGDSIVYMRNATSQVWRYDVTSGAQTMLVDMVGIGGGVSISRDGSTVYYVEQVTPGVNALKSVPMAGGTPASLGLQGPYSDTEAANTKDELILTESSSPNRLKRYDLATGELTHITNGFEPAYKCDDSRIVYALDTGGALSLLYRDEATGAGSTLSTSGLYWPDYMPTCS